MALGGSPGASSGTPSCTLPPASEHTALKVKVTQLCLTLCDLMDYTVHGILQARILEWVAFPFSRGSSQPRDRTQVSHFAGGFFTSWATREAQEYWSGQPIPSPGELPDPGIEPGSLALQADSLPAELTRKTNTLHHDHTCRVLPISWATCNNSVWFSFFSYEWGWTSFKIFKMYLYFFFHELFIHILGLFFYYSLWLPCNFYKLLIC